MKKIRWALTTASIGLALALGLPGAGEAKEPTTTQNHPTTAEDPANTAEARESAPDNTGRNVRDKNGDTLTPVNQPASGPVPAIYGPSKEEPWF
jgi:hypothetical protein